MTKSRWHIARDGDTLTLSRLARARFDVSASTELPDGGRLAVAQQVRQDMWRALQTLRGFAPVVTVCRQGGVLHVTAGGQVDGPVAKAHVQAAIQGVLDDPTRRARWLRHANRGRAAA
ncbi:hypothetical protein BXY66_0928 [Shimia isoporae]|uniref:Uncharacterized protein n=1 Tax=Shimia isoporae TaxID=647720 RepID=A0A4R1NKN9_9RHOB|nr:hypothetical protein [Shimia isoporae]TCL08887.1 hypothetical protein BXY66_0928 [Shimia isoporae]